MPNRDLRPATNPSVCFVVTSPAMVNLLMSEGPAAMGGAELQFSLLGRAFKEKEWDVSFLVGDYGQERRLVTSEGMSVLRAYAPAKSRSTCKPLLRSLVELWRSLAEVDTDIYVSRGLTGQAGVIAAFTRLHHRRYVFWFGKNADAWYGVPRLSPLPLVERLPAWYGIHLTDAVIVQSNEQKALLQRYVGRSGVVVPNVSPWNGTAPDGQPGEYALWIGSIQPKKRPDMLLDVAAQTPEVRFVMAGGKMPAHSDLYDSVRSGAEQTKNVDFLGFVPFDQTKELFEHAALLVSTSRAEEEGFPNVFLQAWSTGTPVVATCDPDEIICRHGLGYHCEGADRIAERTREIAGNHEVQQDMGRRAYRYVSQYHSTDRVVDQLSDFLQDLLTGRDNRRPGEKDVRE